jgi:cell division protein FtsI/penicillin-binding protein 2
MNHKKGLHSQIQEIKGTDSKSGGRFLVLIAGIILIGLLTIIQLFRVQVVYAKKYNTKALGQYVDTTARPFERGTIYFSQKDGTLISAATVATGYKLTVNPPLIKDPEALYRDLGQYSAFTKEEFMERVLKKGDTYEELALRLTLVQANEIKAKKIQGVTLYPESWRNYPGGRLASQVLGFIGFKGDTLSGQYGLERQYNDILSPRSASPFVNFFAEVFSNIDTDEKQNNAKIGNIVTTIEPTVQGYLEKSLADLRAEWGSESVGGIIMDPNTGEIIALANLPDFDPNQFNKEKNSKVFTNAIVESVFEIGSVVKILTMTSGLDAGVVTPDTHYTDTGIVKLNTESIYNARKKSYGYVSMQEVLDKSLNTGATFVMQQLGYKQFREYFYKFGMKEKTGVDLPNEVSNMVKNLESPRELEYATASFGQGIALTPVSAIRAFSAVANGGYLVNPHIVKKIQYEDGTETIIPIEKGEQILKPETSARIAGMLRKVVDGALLSGSVKLQNHTAAAKTGTAEIADAHGGYIENVYLHTMISYFPAYDARYIVFIYNMKPNADDFAAQTLAPTAMDIGQFLMTYYNVPGDRDIKR